MYPASRMISNTRQLCLIGMMAAFIGGCAIDPPLYRWGDYEQIIYQGYKEPGSSDPVTDGQLLAADLERTEAEGKQIPPGARIHLGYLYFEQGRDEEARTLFELEKQFFPESTVFVNGLLARMGAAK